MRSKFRMMLLKYRINKLRRRLTRLQGMSILITEPADLYLLQKLLIEKDELELERENHSANAATDENS